MPGLWRSLALAAAVLLRPTLANAEPASLDLVERQSTSTNNSAATWVYTGDGSGDGNFTFTITVNPSNNDMWFRMAAPSEYSWISIGAGSQMSQAKAFFMAYQGSKDNSITLSARGECDHCEPGYIKGFGLNSQVPPSNDSAPYGISNGTYYVSAFVANGTARAGIDIKSKNQPFMFAVGPYGHEARSDAFDAPMRMHSLHGTFQLDMTQAYGTKLPSLGLKEVGVTAQGSSTLDRDIGSPAHALLMCVSFVIVFPLGILMLRVLNKVKLHAIVQGIGLFLATVGWIIGFIISRYYQRSMSFNNPHQILGILIYILLLAQWATGFLHHRTFQKTQQPTFLIKPHKYGLGALVLALGIVNAALGFRFAVSGSYNLFFVPIVLGMIVLMVIAITLKRFLGSRGQNKVFGGPAPPSYQAPYGSAVPVPQGYAGSSGASFGGARSDVELGKMGPPPSYSNEPMKPREML